MATKEGNFLRGTIGPISMRASRGQQLVSQRPGKGGVKQTADTKKAANTFGMASRLAGHIRRSFANWIEGLCDSDLVSRLNTVTLECLIPFRDAETRLFKFVGSSFRHLERLDFNIKSPLMKYLVFIPQVTYVDGIINVQSPEPDDLKRIRFPNKYAIGELTVVVTQICLAEGKRMTKPHRQTLKIGANGMDRLNMDFPVLEGCLCIVAVFLRYYFNLGECISIINSRDFNPGGICGALIIPGKYQDDDDLEWKTMNNLNFIQ